MVSATRDNPPAQLPGRANFSLLSLQNSADRLHEIMNCPARQRDNFSSCKHLVSPTRDETTRTENACARHDQDIYSYFFPCPPPFCQICNLAERGSVDVRFHINAP